MFKPWYDAMLLTAECHAVIALRLFRLSQGGLAAQVEANRMLTEKVSAAMDCAATIMTGGDQAAVVKGYRRRVRRNMRRLAR